MIYARAMKLVIFDCDGTIVDSQHMIVAAMQGAFNKVGLVPPPRGEILSVVGLSLVPAVGRLLPGGGEPGLAEHLAELYKGAFQALRRDPLNHEPLYPGARAVIEGFAAREDIVLGVATGKSRRGVAALFEREGLDGLFATIQTADDHPSKPHPSMIHRALSEAVVSPESAVMIGDTTYDIEMARAAGVVPLGVSWGYHDVEALELAGAAAIATVYEDIPGLVMRHLEAAKAESTVPRGIGS
jgi:phosphoglycolate phosphatase